MSTGYDYFSKLLKCAYELETSKAKNEQAIVALRELEAKVAELEEGERFWQEERKVLLNRIEDNHE